MWSAQSVLADTVGPTDLLALLGLLGHNWLLWIIGVIVTWLLVTRIVETYEGAAKILGPLGRHILERYRRRDDVYRKRVAEDAKQLALELVPQVLPADYDALKLQVQNLLARVTDLELENAALRSFVVYDEQWHFSLLLSAARSGADVNFPSRYTWLEFRDRWRHGWRPSHLVDDAMGAIDRPHQGDV